jgi:hypothetical protein
MKVPSQTFQATLGSNEENLFIEIPFDVKAIFGKARPPVLVKVKSLAYPSTVSVYGGKSFLPLRKDRRESIGAKAGDVVTVKVTLDTSARTVSLPEDLAKLLEQNSKAKEAWNKLSFSHQREHVDAIEKAKRPETRQRRIENAVAMILKKMEEKTRR